MLKKVSHIGLIILLLVSTTGLTIDLHYCNHKLYDIGVLSEAHNCCMPIENETNNIKHNHCDKDSHQKGNCEDETIQVKHVDDFTASSFNTDFNRLSFISLFLSISAVTDLYGLSEIIIGEVPEWNNSPPKHQVALSLLQKYLL